MSIDFNTSIPIYLQIMDFFKRQIANGSLKPGDRLPSQRDLAVKLKVNANTVQRAYREMEANGMVETLRGQGTFVSKHETIVEEIRSEMLTSLVADFTQAMLALGCSEQLTLELVSRQFTESKDFEQNEVKESE